MKRKQYDRIGETLLTGVLPNGLQVCVLPKPQFGRSFAFFAAQYGGAMRRFTLDGRRVETPAGVAHFLEHKMFDMPGGNALAALSANGASPNAFTASGMTAYHFESTAGFAENLKTLLTFVSTPYFTPESVSKEQGIIGQEIRMTEDDPDFAVYIGLLRGLYAHHPIRDSVVGTVESIAQITDKTLYDCHAAFYRPANMALCVVGGDAGEEVFSTAEELLPKENAPAPEPDYGAPEGPLPVMPHRTAAMAVSAPQFVLGAKVTPAPRGSALLRQRLTGAVALRCLMGRASPFYAGLYAEGLLKNDFYYQTDYSAGTATILAGGESREPERVLARLTEAAERVAQNGLDAAGTERVRRAVYGARIRGLDDFEDLCYDMAQGCFGGYDALDAFELLPQIGADDCAAYIAENLTPERLALSVITPQDTKGQ